MGAEIFIADSCFLIQAFWLTACSKCCYSGKIDCNDHRYQSESTYCPTLENTSRSNISMLATLGFFKRLDVISQKINWTRQFVPLVKIGAK
jgi:hypothetical protein